MIVRLDGNDSLFDSIDADYIQYICRRLQRHSPDSLVDKALSWIGFRKKNRYQSTFEQAAGISAKVDEANAKIEAVRDKAAKVANDASTGAANRDDAAALRQGEDH